MKLSTLGEFGLIRAIQQRSPRRSVRTVVGIGDDAAVLKVSPSARLLATKDMLVEGVHFDLSTTDFYSLGWKSAAVNLSDIAAMGGIPRFCLTAIALPQHISAEQILEFYRGCGEMLKRFKVALVGGDTCASRNGMTISITMLGETDKKGPLTRAGARPGDRIFVTGSLGDSAAGLELRNNRGKGQGARGKEFTKLVAKHLRPVPRVDEGRLIARSGCASSMIDISDGLFSDLGHICDESKTGADISANLIPVSSSLRTLSPFLNKPALSYACSGGEDYELLFTVPPAKVKKLLSLGVKVWEIGTIQAGKSRSFVNSDGRRNKILPTGYDHFHKTAAGKRPAGRSRMKGA